MIQVTEAFRSSFPRARLGLLAMSEVANPAVDSQLQLRKAEIEQELRERHQGAERSQLKQLPVMQAYVQYYARFEKTYHLLLQLESVALKGKPIPSVAALVEAMFMAEIRNGLLTAGHDLEKVSLPLTLGVAAGGERYQGIRGRDETCKGGDMMIADREGIISSVMCGPDSRTRIAPWTTKALFTVYAPEGVEEDSVRSHLQELEGYVRLVSPEAVTQACQVV
jgi:DNA/RNA-binding domain of Phe-tRNA-synthetase-like protein